jgi:hypothetical protein
MKLKFIFLAIALMAMHAKSDAQNETKYPNLTARDSVLLSPLFWKHSSGTGIGFGVGMTNFAGLLTFNASFRFPILTHFAINIRPFLIPSFSSDSNTISAGGRIEFIARSGVMFNMIRVYLACGPQAFYGLQGQAKNEFDWSGGWLIGLEAFYFSFGSVYFEIGTSGGTVANAGSGLTVGTGFQFYPFYKKH